MHIFNLFSLQVCSDWCTVIQCMVGYMKANDNFLIKIRAELNVPVFLQVNPSYTSMMFVHYSINSSELVHCRYDSTSKLSGYDELECVCIFQCLNVVT